MSRGLFVSMGLSTVVAVVTLSGCTFFDAKPDRSDEQAWSQACEIIVDELDTTGHDLTDLIPRDLEDVDGRTLSRVYSVGADSLERARGHVDDIRVGQILDTTSTAMDELAPIAESASRGDPSALQKAAGPLSRLTSVAKTCSTYVDI